MPPVSSCVQGPYIHCVELCNAAQLVLQPIYSGFTHKRPQEMFLLVGFVFDSLNMQEHVFCLFAPPWSPGHKVLNVTCVAC